MTRAEYDNFLRRTNITQKDIKNFIERVLLTEEDILLYINHVRSFAREHDIRVAVEKELAFNFIKALLTLLTSKRTRTRSEQDEYIFSSYLPEPEKSAVYESWRFREEQEREFRHRSEKRRGFYRKGEPTQDCGEDLKHWIALYEYEAKGKKART